MQLNKHFKEYRWMYLSVILIILVILFIIIRRYNRESYEDMPLTNVDKLVGSYSKDMPKLETDVKVTYPKPVPIHVSKLLPKGEIVLYYAMWCGYSKMFLPEWEKFVKYASKEFPTLKVTQIRCEGGNETVCNQKGINGYPTVILYIGNKEIPFEGDRTVEELNKFIRKNL